MSFVTIKKFRRALLAPCRPLLKEWAYAGLIFNYTGATASHLVMRDGVGALSYASACVPHTFSHDRTVLETKADSETALPVMGREAPGFERR
jgi:hypothetical protein